MQTDAAVEAHAATRMITHTQTNFAGPMGLVLYAGATQVSPTAESVRCRTAGLVGLVAGFSSLFLLLQAAVFAYY